MKKVKVKEVINKKVIMNANMMIESEMLTSTLERDMRKLIMRVQREVLEVCAKEYNFDINAAMLLVNAGADRKERVVKEKKERVVKEKATASSGKAKVERKSKGRPKNPEKEVEVEETENLFEQLVNTHLEEEVECSAVFQTKEETKAEKSAEKLERGLMSGEEKDTKVANKAEAKASASAIAKLAKMEAKEAEKLAKEAEKAIAIANAKLAKLEATASAIAAKEQEKLAKEADKVAKEQAKEQEKLAKEQAKEQEKLAKEQAKEAEKLAKEQAKKSTTNASAYKGKKFSSTASSGIASNKTKETAERIAKEANDVEYQAKMTELSEKLEAASGPQIVMPLEVVAVMATASSKEPTASGIAAIAPATLKVKSFKYEGATYFREKNTGAIYDKETNDHLGQWNEATQKIDFLEPEEELEEEEESDGESSDEEEEEEEEESA